MLTEGRWTRRTQWPDSAPEEARTGLMVQVVIARGHDRRAEAVLFRREFRRERLSDANEEVGAAQPAGARSSGPICTAAITRGSSFR